MGQSQGYPTINDEEIPYRVYCKVKLSNETKNNMLNNVSVFYESGDIYTSGSNYRNLVSNLNNGCSHEWVFRKLELSMNGSCGIFTYDLS